MPPKVLDFIRSKRIGVLAIEMPDGAPHAATLHYAHRDEPSCFIFETNSKYRKSEALLARPVSRATLVIGFEEGPNQATFQADGEARALEADEPLRAIYLEKFPEKAAKAADPENLFFSFTPTWWRFTSWDASEGKTIIVSDETMSGTRVGA